VDLLPLNVLIGPNASGKSNLLEALAILRATADDLHSAVREGGGFSEYLWKGHTLPGPLGLRLHLSRSETEFDVVLYSIQLVPVGTQFEVYSERVVDSETTKASSGRFGAPEPAYHYHDGLGLIRPWEGGRLGPGIPLEDLKSTRSVLSQRRDPERYPEITYLAEFFGSIALYQEWNFGRRTPARMPQPTDLPSDFLLPSASNLGLVLHGISQTSAQRDQLIEYLRRFYEPARSLSTKIIGGTIQLFIEEESGRLIPATRLSDGTLRYLCLLAILLHPNPPPVIGIEEPELGLHPDIMPTIAELLKKASERTQLFVTTHSDALVSALSDTPESILVCESMPNGTTINRLEPEKLREWLAEYSLGEIWRMGEIGGNRW
ncbi:MAG TPA: AAA family ATPase, partial [Longimicrobium sp.]